MKSYEVLQKSKQKSYCWELLLIIAEMGNTDSYKNFDVSGEINGYSNSHYENATRNMVGLKVLYKKNGIKIHNSPGTKRDKNSTREYMYNMKWCWKNHTRLKN